MTERLTFGSYTFPCNPFHVKTVCSRHVIHRFSPFCGNVVEDYGPDVVKVSGEGVLFGPDAEEHLAALKQVFRESGKATFRFGGQNFPALFSGLTVLHAADTKEIRFHFEFTEAP